MGFIPALGLFQQILHRTTPKLAYRGWGEFSVWFAFGPMTILIAAAGQGILFHPMVLMQMPATGLSTSSILLAGQMIDLDADRAGGKHGVASRLGTRFTAGLNILVQVGIIVNMLALFFNYPGNTWMFLLPLVPYLLLFPKAAAVIWKHHDDPDKVKEGAKYTVLIHVLFSLLLIAGFVLYFYLG